MLTGNTIMAGLFAIVLLAGIYIYAGDGELTDTGSVEESVDQSDSNITEIEKDTDDCMGRPMERHMIHALEYIRYLTDNFTKDLNLTELSETYNKLMGTGHNRTVTITCPFCNETFSVELNATGMMHRHPPGPPMWERRNRDRWEHFDQSKCIE